jgi:beta-phosphoglucomutase-like phosphatase (HAD superfamily)
MVEAILWDNDGVLVDTECLFFESNRRSLARIGIELSLEQFLELSMQEGRSALDLAREIGLTKEEIANLKRERDLLYSEMLRKQLRVLPAMPETLHTLHGRMSMAVVTSSQRQHFDLMHAETGLSRYFEFVLTREDYAYTKPSPRTLPARIETARNRN